jgi:hypothetical protein
MSVETDLLSLKKIIEFIKADLNGCIKGGVNISLALVLSVYTEFFGHLLTGSCDCGKSYCAWLRYMGGNYEKLADDKVDLYDKIRCGLVHEYAIKETAQIFIENGYPGLELKNGIIYFNNKQYAEDFIKSIEQYLRDFETNPKLQHNFGIFRKGKPRII